MTIPRRLARYPAGTARRVLDRQAGASLPSSPPGPGRGEELMPIRCHAEVDTKKPAARGMALPTVCQVEETHELPKQRRTWTVQHRGIAGQHLLAQGPGIILKVIGSDRAARRIRDACDRSH